MHQLKLKVSIAPSLITFVISCLSIGMGGILSTGVLLGLIFLYVIFKNMNYSRALIIIYSALCFIFLIVVFSDVTNFFIYKYIIKGDLLVKLNNLQFITEMERYKIWSSYVMNLNFWNLLIGVNLDKEFFGYRNIHSSYLLMHARMGFLSFFLMLVVLFSVYKLYKLNYVFFVCFFCILLRGFSDTSFLAGSPFDFIFIFFIGFSYFGQRVINKPHLIN